MDCATTIRKRIASFEAGIPFRPSHFFDAGSRNAVYVTLCRLAKEGIIRRLAIGVYTHCRAKTPTREEIIRSKFERFNKTELKPKAMRTDPFVVFTSGSKSSISTVYGRVTVKHLNPAKSFSPAKTINSVSIVSADDMSSYESMGINKNCISASIERVHSALSELSTAVSAMQTAFLSNALMKQLA